MDNADRLAMKELETRPELWMPSSAFPDDPQCKMLTAEGTKIRDARASEIREAVLRHGVGIGNWLIGRQVTPIQSPRHDATTEEVETDPNERVTIRHPLIAIAPDARKGKPPCGECHLRPGETCSICGAEEPTPPQPARDTKALLAMAREALERIIAYAGHAIVGDQATIARAYATTISRMEGEARATLAALDAEVGK